MAEMRYLVLRVETGGDCSPYCTLGEVAYRAGLHPELIEKFIRLGLVEVADRTGSGDMLFDPGVVPLIRRILRLRNQLGVNYAGIGVILDLMSRIEMLEARINDLEEIMARREL